MKLRPISGMLAPSPKTEPAMLEFILRGRGPNTMTADSLREMQHQLQSHPSDPVLIYGQGKAFSAGLDLDAVAKHGPKELADAIEAAAEALFLHPAPTVAAVNGHAIAGGCLMVQACDLRIGTTEPSMKMGMPGVALGINYPPKLVRILRYRIPAHTIDRVLLEAENHHPEQALQLGLLDMLADDVITAGRERLAALARHPATAYAEAKRTLRAGLMEISNAERARFEAGFNAHWQADTMNANRRDKAG